MTVLSIYVAAEDGSLSLILTNIPFSNLQWNRRLSSCGDFTAQLTGDAPFEWPGRYVITRSDRPEAAIVEKVEAADGEGATISGRMAECLLDHRSFGPGGGVATGANWRQAVCEAFRAWPMPDAPAIAMGEGTEGRTGASYALRAGERDTALDAVLSVTSSRGACASLAVDWAAGGLVLSIREGVDRTRGQSERPPCVFSVDMATASKVSYSGDYSVAKSSVIAYAQPVGEGATPVTSEVAVPGFDAATMWMATASEDVSSLCPDAPSAADAASAGALRAYDHMPSIAIDNVVMGSGYPELWDLGDTVEVAAPGAGVVGASRIEEVREVVKGEGATLEVSLGTKGISRERRAAMRLR